MAVRPPLALLNELSVPTAGRSWDDERVGYELSGMVSLLLAARTLRPDLAFCSGVPLLGLPVCDDGRTLGAWANGRGGRAREELRFLQVLRNHSPYATAPGLVLAEAEEEYLYQDRVAEGLGLSAGNRQLAVSFDPASWPDARVELLYRRAEESGNDVAIREEWAYAFHASCQEHVAENIDVIRQLSLPQPYTGEDLWDDRANMFPSLRFLARVQDDLKALLPGSTQVRQVFDRLRELDETAKVWNPAADPEPNWRSLVTSEFEGRRALSEFIDEDGVSRSFALHARFTPDHGRIHFRLDAGRKEFVVAYVGRKLGI